MPHVLNKILKYSIYVLVFLLPLFWLPFSFEVFEFSKLYLLFFLVSLALLAWLAKMVIYDKELRFKCSLLDYFVLGFLLVAIISAIFSVDKSSSIFGFYGRFSNGLISLLSLGALYFLVTNNVGSVKGAIRDVKGVLRVFLCSAGVVVLISYLSIFKVWQMIGGFLPTVMRQVTFNPVAGSLEGLTVFLAVIIVLLVGLLLRDVKGWLFKGLLLVASLGLLVIVDFTMAWMVLLVSLVFLVGLSLWKRIFRENVNRLLIPILLIIIAAVLIPFKFVNMGLPQEQVLSEPVSWQVGFGAATENVKTGFLGSGIGTFHYDFAKEKPLKMNETWLWQIRFDRAGSHFAEILGTMGFLGLISYLALIGLFLLISYFMMSIGASKSEIRSPNDEKLPLLVTFVALVVAQLLYYQNLTLAFSFWLMLGLAVVSWQKPIEEKIISFKTFPELSLVLSTGVIVLGITILVLYYFGANFYLADMNYQRGLQLLGPERIARLEKAVSFNPHFSRYHLALSRTYLYEALQELQKPDKERDTKMIENRVSKAISEGQEATDLQPNLVQNWESLGVIYREIRGVAQGAAEWGVKSFEKAIGLEPTNPVLYTELGKLYMGLGDTDKAKDYFEQAIDKKSDYSDAIIQQALILEQEKVIDKAIAKLEGLIQANPFDVEARFQLGRLYFNNGERDKAIDQFETVIALVPNHSNAHYSLGVAYADQGQTQKAIEEFEKVLELNPGNQDVISKLEKLKESLKSTNNE